MVTEHSSSPSDVGLDGRQLFERSRDALFVLEEKGRCLDANPAALILVGYTLEELRQTCVEDLLPPDARPGVVLVVGEGVQEIRLQVKRGREVWVESNVARIAHAGQPALLWTVRDVTERKRAEEELRARERHLTLLNDITYAALMIPGFEAMLQALTDRLGEVIEADGCCLTLWDEETQTAVRTAACGNLGDVLSLPAEPGEVTMTASVLRAGCPLIAEDVFDSPYVSPRIAALCPVRSLLGLPLVAGDQKLGVALIAFNEPHRFTLDEIARGEQAAGQVALAIAKARLFASLAQENEWLELLYHLSRDLAGGLSIHDVAQRALDGICDVVGAMRGVAVVRELDSDRLQLVAVSGYDVESIEVLDQRLRLRVGDGLVGRVAAQRQSMLVDDVGKDEQWMQVPGLDDWVRSALSVPLISRDDLVGVLNVYSDQEAFFSDSHRRLAESAAATVAAAIANARLFQAERRQRELAKALEEAAAAVSSTLNLDQVLDRILEQVERVVEGDAFNVMLIEGDHAQVVRCRGYERLNAAGRVPRRPIAVAEYPSLLSMVQTGQPVVVLDTASDPGWMLGEGLKWRRSYVAAPIRVADLTVGFLNVSGTRPGQFGPADARRLEVFASHAATAIENARLYRELRNYAERLEEQVRERTARIRTQYARLEAVLRSTSDGIIVTDQQGEVLQANPVAHTWLTQTFSPQDARRLREAVRELAERAEERPDEVLELTGLDLQLSVAPISELGSEGARAVVAVHDVSHLRALERLKSQFVTNVSHELRTPITTIKLYLALLRRSSPEKWEEYLDALEQETERQVRLVEDILQLSRIDAGRLELKPRPVSLNELAEVAVVSYRALAQDGGLTLEHLLCERELVALADPEQMTWVLNNLLVNAIQYTSAGGRIEVSTGKEEAAGRVWAVVKVADTGIGIPEGELPHIFDRFFRGEEPRKMQVPGTGLGLAIVKEVVELHGGRVAVESQLGEGTTFTIWLPITD